MNRGGKCRGGGLKISGLDIKWEGIEEANKSKLVVGVPCLKGDLIALGRLTKDQVPPQSQLRGYIQALAHGRFHSSWVCLSILGERENDIIVYIIYSVLSGEVINKFGGR